MPKVSKEKPHKARTTINAIPDEVMDTILSRLHEADVPNAEAVCRQWRRLVATTYHRLYPLRLCDEEQFQWCGWDAMAARWRRLPPLMIKPILQLGGVDSKAKLLWLASSRGLVLIRKEKIVQHSFFVCDLVRRKCHELPTMHQFRGWSGQLVAYACHHWLMRFVSQLVVGGRFDLEVGAGGDPKAYTVRALGNSPEPEQCTPSNNMCSVDGARKFNYPLLVVYESGGECWEVRRTTGIDEATEFRAVGKPVVVGGQLFVLGSVGQAHPGRVMALDMQTCVWRVAAQGVQFGDTLVYVASKDMVLVVSEEKISAPASGSELARCTTSSAIISKKFLIHSVRAAAPGGLVLESRCNLSDFYVYPVGEHPNVCRPDMLWSVAESCGQVYITCGSVQEPAYHKGVVYSISGRLWRPWSVGRHGFLENFSQHIPSPTQLFELGGD